MWTARRVRVRYDSWAGVVERELEPVGLALKAGVWYAVALSGGKPRTYRVSSIQALDLSAETFERPAAFDLPAYWTTWVREFEDRLYRSEATLRLSPAGLKALCNVSPGAERAARAASIVQGGDWTTVTVPIESVEHAASDFMKLGVDAEVLAPPELRARMAEIAGRLSEIYAAG